MNKSLQLQLVPPFEISLQIIDDERCSVEVLNEAETAEIFGNDSRVVSALKRLRLARRSLAACAG